MGGIALSWGSVRNWNPFSLAALTRGLASRSRIVDDNNSWGLYAFDKNLERTRLRLSLGLLL